MRVYSLFLILFLCVGLLACTEKEDHSFIYTSLIYNYFLPSEETRKQCLQPNAIPWNTSQSLFVTGGCIYSKVQSGLIFDVDANQNISSNTLASGKRFKCLCNGKVSENTLLNFSWKRSDQLFDNIPQPPPALENIIFVSGKSSPNINYMLTTSAYKTEDNLFCITICNIDSNTYQYQNQFLKIRSSQ